ncbi:MAG: ABC transporter permease, partial [Moraxellaceae bacterium]
VLSAVVNFAISFFVFMAFMLITGDFPGVRIIIIPLLLAAVLVFAIGLGMILGVLNVFFRDVGQLFGIIMQFWFWLTPIVYPVSILPDAIRPLVELNPVTPLIVAFQQVLVFKMWPDWPTLVYPTVIGVILCLLGLRLFRQRAGEMVDEL